MVLFQSLFYHQEILLSRLAPLAKGGGYDTPGGRPAHKLVLGATCLLPLYLLPFHCLRWKHLFRTDARDALVPRCFCYTFVSFPDKILLFLWMHLLERLRSPSPRQLILALLCDSSNKWFLFFCGYGWLWQSTNSASLCCDSVVYCTLRLVVKEHLNVAK